MAVVVSANKNLDSSDDWALVSGGIVINTILASVNSIYQALGNGPNMYTSMDYLVDLTVQGQSASIGWTYNPGGNTFIGPPVPPINWTDELQGDIDGVASGLIQCIYDMGTDGGSLTSEQIQAAYAAAVEDSQASYTPNQAALMAAVLTFILTGG